MRRTQLLPRQHGFPKNHLSRKSAKAVRAKGRAPAKEYYLNPASPPPTPREVPGAAPLRRTRAVSGSTLSQPAASASQVRRSSKQSLVKDEGVMAPERGLTVSVAPRPYQGKPGIVLAIQSKEPIDRGNWLTGRNVSVGHDRRARADLGSLRRRSLREREGSGV